MHDGLSPVDFAELTYGAQSQALLHDGSYVCLPLQRIEAPVRNNDSADKGYAYDGKDISDRQTDVDRLLVDQNQPEEQRFLGTAVAFPDALRFKGAAPEIVNSRYCYPTPCTNNCMTGCLLPQLQFLLLKACMCIDLVGSMKVRFALRQSCVICCNRYMCNMQKICDSNTWFWMIRQMIRQTQPQHSLHIDILSFIAGWPCLGLLQH